MSDALAAPAATESAVQTPVADTAEYAPHDPDNVAFFDNVFQNEAPQADTAEQAPTGERARGPDGKFLKAETAPDKAAPADNADSPPEAEAAKAEDSATDWDGDLTKWAESSGQTPEEAFGHLKVGDKTVAELLKGYAPDAKAKETELAKNREAFEAAVGQARSTWQQKIEQADQLLAHLAGQLEKQPDWDALYAENPALYMKTKAEWDAKINAFQRGIEGRKAQHAQQQRELEGKRAERVQAERDKLLAAMPEWKDEGKINAAMVELGKFAKAKGFSDQEFANVTDHRALLVLHDAMKWQQSQGRKPEVLKKLASLPPVPKPGAKNGKTDPRLAKLNEARRRLAVDPHDDDAHAAFFEGMFKG